MRAPERPFTSIDDVVRRAKLDDGATARLAESGAFARVREEPARSAVGGKEAGVEGQVQVRVMSSETSTLDSQL